jgi:hypothetical protein
LRVATQILDLSEATSGRALLTVRAVSRRDRTLADAMAGRGSAVILPSVPIAVSISATAGSFVRT